MPRTFTVAEMEASVRELLDIESARSFTSAEIRSRLSSGYAKYYAKLVKSGLGYAGENEQTITSTGIAAYPLDDDHFFTLRVDFQYDGNFRRQLHEIDVRELQRVQIAGSPARCYRLVGKTIELYPTPPTGGIYFHKYVPSAAKLVSDAQVVDGVSGWEDGPILDAAVRCLVKGGEDATGLMAERKLVDDRIEEETQLRALTNRRIIRTRTRRDLPDPSGLLPWAWGGDGWDGWDDGC